MPSNSTNCHQAEIFLVLHPATDQVQIRDVCKNSHGCLWAQRTPTSSQAWEESRRDQPTLQKFARLFRKEATVSCVQPEEAVIFGQACGLFAS